MLFYRDDKLNCLSMLNFESQTYPFFTLMNLSMFNSLPSDKILHWSKLKAFADDKINVKEKFKFGLGREENIEGKGENAGNQHFLLIPRCFQKAFLTGSLKVGIVW